MAVPATTRAMIQRITPASSAIAPYRVMPRNRLIAWKRRRSFEVEISSRARSARCLSPLTPRGPRRPPPFGGRALARPEGPAPSPSDPALRPGRRRPRPILPSAIHVHLSKLPARETIRRSGLAKGAGPPPCVDLLLVVAGAKTAAAASRNRGLDGAGDPLEQLVHGLATENRVGV